MKRLTKDGWLALKVFSSHDICRLGKARIYISYFPVDNGRLSRSARWAVISPDFDTDPKAHWMDYGRKTFTVYNREEKAGKLLEAITWASHTYNLNGEWERDPWGDYHPQGTLEAARKKVEG